MCDVKHAPEKTLRSLAKGEHHGSLADRTARTGNVARASSRVAAEGGANDAQPIVDAHRTAISAQGMISIKCPADQAGSARVDVQPATMISGAALASVAEP